MPTDPEQYEWRWTVDGKQVAVLPGNEQPERIATVERFTVSLIQDAVRAMTNLQARTGYSKVDIINRALQIYEFMDLNQREGATFYIRPANVDRDKWQQIHFVG